MSELKGAIVPVTPLAQNCALLWDETAKRGTVVDPGGDVERLLEAVAELGLAVEQILLTHGHIDHAGGAAELKEQLEARFGHAVPIVGPDERDLFLLQGLEEQGRRFGVAGARNLVPDCWLKEGEAVEIAGHSFAIHHCPGHTPGHLVFLAPEQKLAILGDVLFQGSVGRTDFPYGDHAALLEAIRTKLLPLPDDVSFLCGHGPGSTIGAERRTNPFLVGLTPPRGAGGKGGEAP